MWLQYAGWPSIQESVSRARGRPGHFSANRGVVCQKVDARMVPKRSFSRLEANLSKKVSAF